MTRRCRGAGALKASARRGRGRPLVQRHGGQGLRDRAAGVPARQRRLPGRQLGALLAGQRRHRGRCAATRSSSRRSSTPTARACARSPPRPARWRAGARRQITPPELSGGTFTVSNLGMYGITNFHAGDQPAAGGDPRRRRDHRDAGVPRRRGPAAQLMGVTLACDHRILYGADGAEFLGRVRGAARRAARARALMPGPPSPERLIDVPIESLPFVDEHYIEIAASPDQVWDALVAMLRAASEGRPARRSRGARLRSYRDARESRRDRLDDPRLRRHPLGPARRAGADGPAPLLALRADLLDPREAERPRPAERGDPRRVPGRRGRAYRGLVIGTRGHVLATKAMLRAVRKRAERAPAAPRTGGVETSPDGHTIAVAIRTSQQLGRIQT